MSRLAAPELDAPPLARYGLPEPVYGAQPAAGAHYSAAIDGAFFTRLLSVFCRVVTDSTVATRTVTIEYRDADGNRFSLDGAPVQQLASTTTDYHFSPLRDENVWPVDATVLAKLTPLLLPPTWTFRIYVASIQSTDQVSRVRYVWERFYTHAQPVRNAPRPGD